MIAILTDKPSVGKEIGRIIDEENLKDTIDIIEKQINESDYCLLYTSPSPRDS